MAGIAKLIEEMMLPLERTSKGFKNWHGSPWKFDRFKDEAIGTGEGNQSFGMGHYTADAQDTGITYREALKGKGDRYEHPSFGVVAPAKVAEYLASVGRRVDPRRYGDLKAMATASHILDSRQPVEQQLADVMKGTYPDQKGWKAMLEELAQFKKIPNEGALYEVNIGADPKADFLYQNRPFAAQSPKVQEALTDLRATVSPSRSGGAPRLGLLDDSGRMAYARIANRKGSERAASQALLDRGVQGIRYPDAGSRTGNMGTYNTITFDPRIIEIVKRYGITAALGAGVISQEMADQMHAQGIDKEPDPARFAG